MCDVVLLFLDFKSLQRNSDEESAAFLSISVVPLFEVVRHFGKIVFDGTVMVFIVVQPMETKMLLMMFISSLHVKEWLPIKE